MKIFINKGFFHHMNKQSFDEVISYLKFKKVNNMKEADIIYSPSLRLDTTIYPEKKFIFGPHFSVFPNQEARAIKNRFNNAIYIQPSQPSVDTWVKEFDFKNIPVKSFPFPILLEKYPISKEDKDTVLIYFKERSPNELDILKKFIDSKNVKYDLISYGNYNELEYQKKLNKAKFVIWLGRNESQGFELESVLAKNIPILVWDVTQRSQQFNCPREYYNVKSEVTTVPYWDSRCGVKFYSADELEKSYDFFIKNIENFNPRNFVEENLSIEKCSKNFLELIK